ncbi:MAG: helix-turn-helix domain-containing protein [Cellulosilyticaceae bacterium]
MHLLIQTPGEKIKALRLKYHLKQDELCGTTITRNMLSMIENNKTTLNTATATHLLANLKQLCKEKQLTCEETIEYILELPLTQATRLCKDFIHTLDTCPNNLIDTYPLTQLYSYERICDDYNLLSYKLNIYFRYASAFKKSANYIQAYSYYLHIFNAQAYLIDQHMYITSVLSLMYCCNRLGWHRTIIEFKNTVFAQVSTLTLEQSFKLSYNAIVAHKTLEDYDTSIATVNNLLESHKELSSIFPIQFASLQMIKANSLSSKHRYLESLNLHNELLLNAKENIELTLATLGNIMTIFIETKNTKDIQPYLKQAAHILPKYIELNPKLYPITIYLDLANSYAFLGDSSQCFPLYRSSINLAIESKNMPHIQTVLKAYLQAIIDIKTYGELDTFRQLLNECISLNLISDYLIITSLIHLYLDLDYSDEAKNLCTFIATQIH